MQTKHKGNKRPGLTAAHVAIAPPPASAVLEARPATRGTLWRVISRSLLILHVRYSSSQRRTAR